MAPLGQRLFFNAYFIHTPGGNFSDACVVTFFERFIGIRNHTSRKMKEMDLQWIVKLWKDPKYSQIRGVFWFVVITLVIHYSYRFWAQDLHYYPIQLWMASFRDYMAQVVFDQSTWVDQHLLGLDLIKEGRLMRFDNGAAIWINGSCSGDKQILQLTLLLLIYHGKWKYKLWFIPLGIILVHATNILRIVLLSLVAIWRPEWMEIVHDTVLRGMFYIVIFGIWLLFAKLSERERKIRNKK